MSKKLYPEEDIQNIANAIRTLNGSSDSYTVSEMASAIELPENAYYLKSASGNPINITDGEELKCQSALVTFAPKQSGTGDPSPSNIRPISGWDGLSLMRTGKNLCNSIADNSLSYSGYTNYTLANGKVTISGNTLMGFLVSVKPSTVYTYSIKNSNQVSMRVREYSGKPTEWQDDSFIVQSVNETKTSGNNSSTFTTTANTKYILCAVYCTIANTNIEDFQVELGSTATTYEPYQGQTHTATFPETIMGGSYDFVSGKVTIKGIFITYTDASIFTVDTNNRRFYTPKPTGAINSTVEGSALSNMYKWMSSTATASNFAFYVGNSYFVCYDDTINSIADLQQLFNTTPLQLYVELATPIEITLTPEQIELLKGSNTVSTDGDTVELEYWSKSNTVPLLNMLSMGTMNISNINNENNGNEVEEIPVEESKESLEEIENINNSENE